MDVIGAVVGGAPACLPNVSPSGGDGDVPLPAQRTPVGAVFLPTTAVPLDHLLRRHASVELRLAGVEREREGGGGKKCEPASLLLFHRLL